MSADTTEFISVFPGTSTNIRISVEMEGQNTTVGGKVFNVQTTCFGPSSGPSSGLKIRKKKTIQRVSTSYSA
jgi:hypothetical protein